MDVGWPRNVHHNDTDDTKKQMLAEGPEAQKSWDSPQSKSTALSHHCFSFFPSSDILSLTSIDESEFCIEKIENMSINF